MKNRFIEKITKFKFLMSDKLYIFIPQFKTWAYTSILETKTEEIKNDINAIKDLDKKVELDRREIIELLKKELQRKKYVEDKAKANLFAITVSVSVLLTGISLLAKEDIAGFISSSLVAKVVFTLLCLGIIYLLLGGLYALSSIRVKEIWDIYLKDVVELNGCDEVTIKKEFVRNIELNQIMSTKRTNYMESSYVSIRNGIVCVLLSFIIAATALFYRWIPTDWMGNLSQKVKNIITVTPQESMHHDKRPIPKKKDKEAQPKLDNKYKDAQKKDNENK